jgi:hypothetical protein
MILEVILSSGREELEVVADVLVAAVDVAEVLLLSLLRGDDVNGAPRISTSTPLFQYLNVGGGAAAVVCPPVFDLEGGL